MASFVARPTKELDGWLKENLPKVPHLEPCWKAALTKLEADPGAGKPLQTGSPVLGVQFPSDKDIKSHPAYGMFPVLLIAYTVDGNAVTVMHAKVRS